VQDRQEWIAKTLHRLELERQSLPQELVSPCPERIVLGAIPETWDVVYQSVPRDRTRYRITGTQIVTIEGNVEAIAPCQEVLRHWLAARAKGYLPDWLRRVSEEVGLPCNDITIRKQRTRWASCSSKKNISLNHKLLFLPPHLVRYIFVHELCHTVYMNHSHRFWGLVGEIDPHYEWKDQELRQAWKYVPQWADDLP
jgi:predicted metal-dependent hydrolase